MKLNIIFVMILCVLTITETARASDQIWYISEDARYASSIYQGCKFGNVNELKKSLYLENIRVDGGAIAASYRGRPVMLAWRSLLPRDGCLPAQKEIEIDGKTVSFRPYRLKEEAVITVLGQGRDPSRGMYWMYFDGTQRALVVEWSTLVCEDPGDLGGAVLISNPDDIYFLKDFAQLAEAERAQHIPRLAKTLGFDVNDLGHNGIVNLYFDAHEIDLFPETRINRPGLLAPQPVEDLDLILDLNTTRTILRHIQSDVPEAPICE